MDTGEDLMEMGGCGLYVAEFHRLDQAFHGITGRNKLLAHEALVTNVQQLTHDGWVIDFLGIIEFFAPWIARGVHVTDDVLIFLDTPDHITVHDLHMVNIKKHLHVG